MASWPVWVDGGVALGDGCVTLMIAPVIIAQREMLARPASVSGCRNRRKQLKQPRRLIECNGRSFCSVPDTLARSVTL